MSSSFVLFVTLGEGRQLAQVALDPIILAHAPTGDRLRSPFLTALFTGPDLLRQVWRQVVMFSMTAVVLLLVPAALAALTARGGAGRR